MSLALLYSGQGTQHPRMLSWLDERHALVQRMCAMLGVADWRQALADPLWAARNRHAQVLLTGLALAASDQLASLLPTPTAVAGYSVGELAAFGIAGVFESNTALDLADKRAQTMDRCAAPRPGGLLSVSGLPRTTVASWCEEAGVWPSIDIDEQTQVVGGPSNALHIIATRAALAGGRADRLQVALASHTPMMQSAALDFAIHLANAPLRAPALPLFCNLNGAQVHSGAQAAQALAQQIAQTVAWYTTLNAIHERRVSCALEIGPGRSLATMWNRRFPEVPARSADEFHSVQALVRWVARQSGC